MRVRTLIGTAVVLFVPVVALFVLTVGLHRTFGPLYYSSDPIRARVIDESTAQPVEGAVAVAIWILESPWYSDRPLHAAEAVTDHNGDFVIPAMRKRRPWLMVLNFRDPQIHIYKPGFGLETLDNYELYVRPFVHVSQRVRTTTLADGRIMAAPATYSTSSKRVSYWNGKTIPLERDPADDPKSAAHSYDYFWSNAIHWLPPEQFPQAWRALIVGWESIPANSRRHSHPNDYIAYMKEIERESR